MHSSMKPIVWIESLTALGLIFFWAGFFTVGLAPENPPPCYFVFEHAFPLPDLILAVALLFAARQLSRGKALGKTLSLLCAGALAFLGILDFSFNIQNGMYAVSAVDLVLNALINLWCVSAGVWTAVKLHGAACV